MVDNYKKIKNQIIPFITEYFKISGVNERDNLNAVSFDALSRSISAKFSLNKDSRTMFGDCSLHVEFTDSKPVFDENGDGYQKFKIKVLINYPSHGQSSIVDVEKRIALISKVTWIAIQIEKEYGDLDIFELVETKAQREDTEKAFKDMKVFDTAAKELCGYMRLNQAKEVMLKTDREEYTFHYNGKAFKFSKICKGPTSQENLYGFRRLE